jgi:hypothetical protein
MNYYIDDDVLGEFYKALAGNNERVLRRIHIPRSDVFYVREALYQKTGVRYTLDRIERAMYLEGHLNKSDVFEPNRKRDWE